MFKVQLSWDRKLTTKEIIPTPNPTRSRPIYNVYTPCVDKRPKWIGRSGLKFHSSQWRMNVWYLIIKSTLSIILFLDFKLRFRRWPTSDNAMATQPQIFGTAAATKDCSQINEPQHMHGLTVLFWIPIQAKWSFHSPLFFQEDLTKVHLPMPQPFHQCWTWNQTMRTATVYCYD